MAAERLGRPRLRRNFRAVLDHQVAELAWMAREATVDPDVITALADCIGRIRETSEALDLPTLTEAADNALHACRKGRAAPRIDALIQACRRLDGVTPVFRPLLVQVSPKDAPYLRHRASSCSVHIEVRTEPDALVRRAANLEPFAIVVPSKDLGEVSQALRKIPHLATVSLFVYEAEGGNADVRWRLDSARLGAIARVPSPLDLPDLLWHVRSHNLEDQGGRGRVLALGEEACIRLGDILDAQQFDLTKEPSSPKVLEALRRSGPQLAVLDAAVQPGVVTVIRTHECWSDLDLMFLGRPDPRNRLFLGSGDYLDPRAPDAALVAQIEGRLARGQRMQGSALNDRATGAMTRNGFLMLADRAVGLSRRDGSLTGVALIDVDGLERAAAKMGAGAGDELMRYAVQLVRASVRETDAVGRVREGSLAVLMAGCSAEQARDRLSEIQVAFSEALRPDPDLAGTTLSVGVADTRREEGGVLHRAEEALLRGRLRGPTQVGL